MDRAAIDRTESAIKFLSSLYSRFDPLTRDKWSEYCIVTFKHMNEYLWEEMDEVYRTIASSPFLVQKFLVLPSELQGVLIKYFRSGVSVQNALNEVFLCYRVEQQYPTLRNCWMLPFYSLVTEIERIIDLSSNDLYEASTRLLKLRDYKPVKTKAFLPGMLDTTTYLLAALYGDRRVVEALNSWKQHMGDLEPYQLTILVDNFESCQEMPIEWVLETFQQVY